MPLPRSVFLQKLHAAQDVLKIYQNWPMWFLSRVGVHPGGATIEIKVNGCSFTAPNSAESWGIADQVWRSKLYTRHFPILESYRVLDIGAHYGFFSVFAAQQNSGVRVASYEPSKSTFDFLKKNLHNNLDREHIFAFNFGLSDKSAESFFYKPEGHDASGTLFKQNLGQSSSSIIEERVRIEEAGRIWDVFGSYHFAKLDCEGAEFAILRSLGGGLRRLGHIVLEYHEDPKEIVRLLLSNGFSILEVLPLENNSPWNAFSDMGMLYAINDHFQANAS